MEQIYQLVNSSDAADFEKKLLSDLIEIFPIKAIDDHFFSVFDFDDYDISLYNECQDAIKHHDKWFYLDDNIIGKYLTDEKGDDTIRNFHIRYLTKFYQNNIEYQEVKKDNIVIQNFLQKNKNYCKKHNKKYYIVTGRCLIHLLTNSKKKDKLTSFSIQKINKLVHILNIYNIVYPLVELIINQQKDIDKISDKKLESNISDDSKKHTSVKSSIHQWSKRKDYQLDIKTKNIIEHTGSKTIDVTIDKISEDYSGIYAIIYGEMVDCKECLPLAYNNLYNDNDFLIKFGESTQLKNRLRTYKSYKFPTTVLIYYPVNKSHTKEAEDDVRQLMISKSLFVGHGLKDYAIVSKVFLNEFKECFKTISEEWK